MEHYSSDAILDGIDTAHIYAIIPVISDSHTGSTVGIMPANWTLQDGSVRQPNALQTILLKQWQDDWGMVRKLRGMAPMTSRMIVVDAGDQIDGDHHATTQLVTRAIDEQERMRVALLRAALDSCGFVWGHDALYGIGGTDVHDGTDSSSTERIIRALLNRTDVGGSYVKQMLRLRVNGVLFEIAHQGVKPGSRRWSYGNQMRSHLTHEYLKRLENHEPMARYMLYGHYHQFEHASVENQRGQVICDGFVLPTYSFKSYYAQAVMPHAKPDIGMWLGIVYQDGSSTWRCPMLSVQQESLVEC